MERKYGYTTETITIQFPYSTVTDLLSSTKRGSRYIPYLKFVCVIIYFKGSIISTKYKYFDIIFEETIDVS